VLKNAVDAAEVAGGVEPIARHINANKISQDESNLDPNIV
jgi:hypothetical protein